MKLDIIVCLFFSLAGIRARAQGQRAVAKDTYALIQQTAIRGREDS